MIAFLTSAILHPFWVYHFVIVKKYELLGLAYASGITNLITFLIMRIVYSCCLPDLKDTNIWPDRRVFKNFKEYINLGVPNAVAMMIDNWEQELLTLAAGWVGVKHQAGMVILLNLLTFAYMGAYGMQSPGCTMIG